jgi:DNA-binding NarL/FixJ family response regulator
LGFIAVPSFFTEAHVKIMITVLLADDHVIIREVLRLLLEKTKDMQIVAMAANGQEAVDLASAYTPQVVVMDISMPTMNGIEAARQINAKYPQMRILMISMYDTFEYVKNALRAGASGYVLKDDVGDELAVAVRAIHQGGRYFSKKIAGIARSILQ